MIIEEIITLLLLSLLLLIHELGHALVMFKYNILKDIRFVYIKDYVNKCKIKFPIGIGCEIEDNIKIEDKRVIISIFSGVIIGFLFLFILFVFKYSDFSLLFYCYPFGCIGDFYILAFIAKKYLIHK